MPNQDFMTSHARQGRGTRGKESESGSHLRKRCPEWRMRLRGVNEGDFSMDNRDEITIQESIADEITETIKGCYDILFNVCAAFGVDWKPYCATLMRDLADHVEL